MSTVAGSGVRRFAHLRLWVRAWLAGNLLLHDAHNGGESMPEAWELYYEDFHRRAARVPEQRFDRARAFAEAAHDAYRAVADRLSNEAQWSDDHTLHVMHALNAAMKQWIDCGDCAWDDLRTRLQTAWQQATVGGNA